MPSMRKGSHHTPESIAKMKATRARMWEDPAYAARQRAQLFLGHQSPHSRAVPHPRMQGEKHPLAKLTDAQVATIRQRYAAGGTTLKALAREYHVARYTIFRYIHEQSRPF